MKFLLAILFLIPLSSQATITYKYNFLKKDHFQVAYADYPVGQESFFELNSAQNALLPSEIKTNIHGLKVSGNNHSDDLFMYAYKKLSGLKPNTQYHVNFSVEFASNANNSVGTGGSPGSSVYIKIGATNQKPKRTVDHQNMYRIAIDKGEQGSDGKDMIVIGTIGVNTSDGNFSLKNLPYEPDQEMKEKMENFKVTSNNEGEAWLIVGSDSAFESKTTLFYTNIVAVFNEVN
jgi:hypothetical protein